MRYDYSHPDIKPDSDDIELILSIHHPGESYYPRICPDCGSINSIWYRQNWWFCFTCNDFFRLERSIDYQTFLDEQESTGAYSPDEMSIE